jgi:hypothetical protein
MTQLHSITFEKVKLKGSGVEGTKEYHILYLFHSKANPGIFEIIKQNPFLKEKTTSTTFDFHTRIVGYSTDVPIVVMCDGQDSIILMPDHHGQLVLLPPEGYPARFKYPPGAEFEEIIGISPDMNMQFLIFPEFLIFPDIVTQESLES